MREAYIIKKAHEQEMDFGGDNRFAKLFVEHCKEVLLYMFLTIRSNNFMQV